MHQPVEYQPLEIAVDGILLEDGVIECWGIAKLQPNGKYQCLARVAGSLCRIEIVIQVRE